MNSCNCPRLGSRPPPLPLFLIEAFVEGGARNALGVRCCLSRIASLIGVIGLRKLKLSVLEWSRRTSPWRMSGWSSRCSRFIQPSWRLRATRPTTLSLTRGRTRWKPGDEHKNALIQLQEEEIGACYARSFLVDDAPDWN